MAVFEVVVGIVAGLALFLYSISSLTEEVENLVKTKLRNKLLKIKNRGIGIGTGTVLTAMLQSSSAFSALVVSLTSASAISLSQAIALLIGANIGTTVTAQLVSFNITILGPLLIALGFLISLKKEYGIAGKSLFFLGILLFSLQLLESNLSTIELGGYEKAIANPYLALLLGIILTAVVQSSSVVTSLAVVAATAGAVPTFSAVLVVLGANIGTSSTALLASRRADKYGRAAATFHVLYNVVGVLIFLPIIIPFFNFVVSISSNNPGRIVANTHTLFNAATAILFAIAMPKVEEVVRGISGAGEREVSFVAKNLVESSNKKKRIENVKKELFGNIEIIAKMSRIVKETSDLSQTRDEGRFRKYAAYISFLHDEIAGYIKKTAEMKLSKKEASLLSLEARTSIIIEEIANSIERIYAGLNFSKMKASDRYFVAKAMETLANGIEEISKEPSRKAGKETRDNLYSIIHEYYNYLIKDFIGEYKGEPSTIYGILAELERIAPEVVSLSYSLEKIKKG
ncbi:MAG: Na/Pi cotransporter family protein [Methanobacteriota archaeon]|nr:MAG: Na/Pi cotransporter family protein [Euryarchaeota archaeon]